MSDKKNILKIIIIILVTAFVSVAVTLLCVNIYLRSLPVPLDDLVRVERIIDEHYVGKYDSKKIEENVLSAYMGSIGDRYAAYYDQKSMEAELQEIDGYMIGIGVEVLADLESNTLEVVSVYDGTPAHKAGVKTGDLIIAVDGKSYDAGSMAEAVEHIKGISEKDPMNKELTLSVKRGEEVLDIKLKRGKIELNRVESEIIDGICYIRFTGFDINATKKVSEIIDSLEKDVKGIVFDIRDNPGGEFESAIDLCDIFLEKQDIMYTVDKKGNKTVYSAKDGKTDLPLAVMVNGSSASASEIFAGSMKANKRAVIVGEKTYGKGVTQSIMYINPRDLSAGAIKFTICKNYTPDGKWINDSIIPDVEVKTEPLFDNIREDAAFKAAVESLKVK